MFPWKKLLGYHCSLTRLKAVYDFPVCQIRVCMCLHINLLAAVTRCSSTHYYYGITSLTPFLLILLLQKYIFKRRDILATDYTIVSNCNILTDLKLLCLVCFFGTVSHI